MYAIRSYYGRLKEHGIGVEGTIILGTDDQDEDYIKRLVDFLLEVELDVAEFTIMTPFPHSPIRAQLERRITSYNVCYTKLLRSQPFTGDYLLSTNSGFGGVNAALILGRGSVITSYSIHYTKLYELVFDWRKEPAVWHIRQSGLFELHGQKLPMEGFLEFDTGAERIRLLAFQGLGAT